MSYHAQSQLENDPGFQQRTRACAIQQANVFKDDQRPDWQAVADDVLRDAGQVIPTFNRLAAAGPGIADKADTGDGGVDQSRVTDDDLLSLTQANWPTVAALYYDGEGNPIGGT